ncbi:UDP-N-acetylmuramoyl-L-alanine--D-glutamate ligase [Patescibacteria group bacterium]
MLDFKKELRKRFKNKTICIVGFGREGASTFKILRKIFPDKIIGIADVEKKQINDKLISTYFGKNYLKNFYDYDVIFRSPGIPVDEIKKFTKKNSKITSQTKLFFDLCPSIIIGITGTKGKSTTASLIHQVLKTQFDSYLIGNIGYPPLDHLKFLNKNSKIIFELSSHQLSDLHKSPHIAVMLNLFPEHLDYYSSFDEYVEAKANITKFQTEEDYLVYNSQDSRVNKIAQSSRAKKIDFSIEEKAILIKDSPLIGQFNLINIMPSIIIGRHFKISDKKIIEAVKHFKPLDSRLEKVRQYSGITFINDSLATIPQATIAAINSLKEEIGSLIVGGFDRGINQTPLAEAIINSSIPTVILFPDTGKKIKKIIEKRAKRKINLLEAKSMKQIVKFAFENTETGKICLLSPGAASFNMFRDYKDRGDQFKKAVWDLKTKKST